MSQSAGSFFIELSSLFNPKGFEDANKKMKESAAAYGGYFTNLTDRGNRWGSSFSQISQQASQASLTSVNRFFDISSKNFLNFENLAKNTFASVVNSFISSLSQMATSSIFGGLFGGGGGAGGLFGSLLGSRRTGGPISQTGPYYLHEGEFVLPPEVVSAIKSGRAPKENSFYGGAATSGAAGGFVGGAVNITVNTPITINADSASVKDAKTLCDEIAAAARRGVSWAVEQAKISYKIGKQKSTEASL
ncbi:MAG: hypothetical protein LBM71_05675 [Elusimicrobiota bacterium]|jgi:hypothetical protein|nr:hypothetical protein [Elusimicrobiota bacterium]